MTEPQSRALAYIRAFWEEHGFAPSMQNVAEGLGLRSRGGAHRLIHVLVARGYLTISPGRARSIRLTKAAAEAA